MNLAYELSKFEAGSEEDRFFKRIFEKLEDSFVRKSVAQDVKEARNALNNVTQRYFESYIIANAVVKSVEHVEVIHETNSVIPNFNKVGAPNVNSLYINLVKKYLPPDEASENLKLFGLTQADVHNALEIQKKSEGEHAAFKKLVEKNVNEFCQRLIRCTGGKVYSNESWQAVFNKTIKELESKATLLSIEENRHHSEKELRDMTKTYYEELSKEALLLSKLLYLYEQKLEFESFTAEYYLQRCHTVHLKLKVFGDKILEATYNKDTISALKKISNELDLKEQQLKEEQNKKTVALESYLKLGEEYENFIEEYARLTKCIKDKQWAIDELKNNIKPKSSE